MPSPRERALATLAGQLTALEADIAAARRASHRASVDRPAPREPAAALRGERVTLADGAQIVIRPIEPEDMHDLAIGFARLGALSRFRLFGQPVERLTHEQLVDLTHVDHESREALIAFDAASGEGVGIARYARQSGEPTRAEVDCTVADGWQHRGVGTALADRLTARARAAGIERCSALIVLGNEPARRLLAHVAGDMGEPRSLP